MSTHFPAGDDAALHRLLRALKAGRPIALSAADAARLKAHMDESVDRLFDRRGARTVAERATDALVELAFDALEPFYWALLLNDAVDRGSGAVVRPIAPPVDPTVPPEGHDEDGPADSDEDEDGPTDPDEDEEGPTRH